MRTNCTLCEPTLNSLWTIPLLFVVAALWMLALRVNRHRIEACDGSGDADHGIVVFVEPVRWLFIVWGFGSFCRGLRRGGCDHYVRLFRWSGRAGALLVLPDFLRRKRLLKKADRLARFIDELAAEYPGQTVHLTGYSTGCYLVLEALKHVRNPVCMGEVILLAGAVSPRYCMDGLSSRGRRVHNFHSYLDFVIGGVAPAVFGSNDGRRAPGCGMVGFHQPPPFVTQYRWSASAIPLGYFGDHFSITSSAFVAKRIAPIVVASS